MVWYVYPELWDLLSSAAFVHASTVRRIEGCEKEGQIAIDNKCYGALSNTVVRMPHIFLIDGIYLILVRWTYELDAQVSATTTKGKLTSFAHR
jgi:hypothetical protein